MTELAQTTYNRSLRDDLINPVTKESLMPYQLLNEKLLGTTELQETLHLFAALGNDAQDYKICLGNGWGYMEATVSRCAKTDIFAAELIDPKAAGDNDDLIQIAQLTGMISNRQDQIRTHLQTSYTSALRAVKKAGGIRLAGAFAQKLKDLPREEGKPLILEKEDIDKFLNQLRPDFKADDEFILPDISAELLEQKVEDITRLLICSRLSKDMVWEYQLFEGYEKINEAKTSMCQTCGGINTHKPECLKKGIARKPSLQQEVHA